jgi:hypothetical protein
MIPSLMFRFPTALQNHSYFLFKEIANGLVPILLGVIVDRNGFVFGFHTNPSSRSGRPGLSSFESMPRFEISQGPDGSIREQRVIPLPNHE